MAAHLNNYLFGEHYQAIHKMSVEQALSGKVAKINSELMSPEEYDDAYTGSKLSVGRTPFAETHAKNMAPTNIPEFLRNFQGNWADHLAGNSYKVAATLRDLTKTLREQSVPNPVTLYRGATRNPSEDVGSERTTPLSFTDDRYVARSFASINKMKKVQIYKAHPGSVNGVPLSEIGGVKRTIGRNRRSESEWLVLPESIRQDWSK